MSPTGTPTPSSNPPTLHPDTVAVRGLENAVRALETHREHMAIAMDKLSDSTRDARDRVLVLETKVDALTEKVDALPTKTWIGTVVVSAMGFFAAVIGIIGTVVHFWH